MGMNKLIIILIAVVLLAGCMLPETSTGLGNGRAVTQIVSSGLGKAYIVVVADNITLCEVTFEDNVMSDTIICKRAVIK